MAMYKGWQVSDWRSPVAEVDRLLMVSLTDENRELVIVLEGSWVPGRPRWRVRFRPYSGYRNLDERYRGDLWQWLHDSSQGCGGTFIVEEDPPFASWGTDYLKGFEPSTKHFVVCTEDDVIEVLSSAWPTWEAIEPAAPESLLPGKSQHLFVGEDDEAIQQLVDDIQAKNMPRWRRFLTWWRLT